MKCKTGISSHCRTGSSSRAADLAAKTPHTRDRYIDFLRAFSISAVVFGHWISSIIELSDGGIRCHNAVGVIPGMWVLTWVFQVMPLFFFVGGFSNLVALDSITKRGGSAKTFLRIRAVRLLKPTGVFLAVWFAVLIAAAFIFQEGVGLARSLTLAITPLWFLAVYLLVICVAPFMVTLHRVYRIWIPIALFLAVVAVDLLRFLAAIPYVSWANVAFVWLFVHQLGFFYADGSLVRAPKWIHVAMASGGLLALVLLTNIGVYPRSMVGTGTEEISNMNPPTVCIPVLAFWLIGAALLLREAIQRWLMRPLPWLIVVQANRVIVTVYLWHLTAYTIVFLLFIPLAIAQESAGTLMWWLQRPLWIAASAAILVGFIGVFGRFERLAKIKSPLSKEAQ